MVKPKKSEIMTLDEVKASYEKVAVGIREKERKILGGKTKRYHFDPTQINMESRENG